MKIILLTVGKTTDLYIKQGIEEYCKRLRFYSDFSIFEIPEIKASSKLSLLEIKKKEGEQIVSKISSNSLVILLDENGKEFTSRQFAAEIQKIQNGSNKEVVFIVGGAYGFSEEVYAKANYKISLSKMTFSHQMIRLFFVEQIYRAYSILNNLPYHHD